MTKASDVVQLAQSYLGTTMGSATHKNIIDTYNAVLPLPAGYRVTYNDDWCDAFVTFLAIKTGAVDLIGRECGVQRHIGIFKAKGIWIEDGTITPRPGDIITFNWDSGYQPNDGFSDHIGIVEQVVGNQIYTIEGNTDRAVRRRTYAIGNGYIRGFARPKYSTASTVKQGWEKIDNEWYYYDNGVLAKNGWRQVNGKWYLFDAHSKMLTGWQTKDNKWYYFTPDGKMHTGWSMIKGKWYLFDKNGAMVEGWRQSGEKWYYFNADGAMHQGWLQDKSGAWYYLSKPDGEMVIGKHSIDGKGYVFDSSGKMK